MSVSVLSIAAASLLRLEIRVADSDWVGTYDTLEVHRSLLGEGGPYQELSAPAWLQAVLPVDALGPSNLSGPSINITGKSLELKVNEQFDVLVTFTGSNPLTYAVLATQIGAQSGGHVSSYVDTAGKLVVQSQPVGGMASLRVVGGDAAVMLGLPVVEPDSLAFGSDPRIALVPGVTSYTFKDYYSVKTYYYKTRFSNRLTGLKSDFSSSFSASNNTGVDPSNIAIGFVRLVTSDGRPAAKQNVTLYNSFLARSMDGSTIVGGPQKITTDDTGYAEFPLLRGIIVDIGVEGTSLVRRVTVPTDSTVLKFDVFDPAYGADDNFSVQRADLPPYANRTAL